MDTILYRLHQSKLYIICSQSVKNDGTLKASYFDIIFGIHVRYHTPSGIHVYKQIICETTTNKKENSEQNLRLLLFYMKLCR